VEGADGTRCRVRPGGISPTRPRGPGPLRSGGADAAAAEHLGVARPMDKGVAVVHRAGRRGSGTGRSGVAAAMVRGIATCPARVSAREQESAEVPDGSDREAMLRHPADASIRRGTRGVPAPRRAVRTGRPPAAAGPRRPDTRAFGREVDVVALSPQHPPGHDDLGGAEVAIGGLDQYPHGPSPQPFPT
jgi:hypothetical protein